MEATEQKRYSKEELEEFRVVIEEKLAKARKDLELLKEALTGTSDNDTADTSPTFKVLEEGQTVLSKEENGRLALRQQKFIDSLELALVRIENGTYGVCRETGKLIPKERLMSVPHATLSIEAKNKLSNKK
ncbi:MAG: TraR/DksA C4-type zinc finger protein [Bacteroidales bacterium]|nr:TraR/DksA C4-type zinc finger protein [Bacteroidales bacterium]